MRDADRNKHIRPTIGGHGFGNKKDDNKKDVGVSKCINIEFTNGIDYRIEISFTQVRVLKKFV